MRLARWRDSASLASFLVEVTDDCREAIGRVFVMLHFEDNQFPSGAAAAGPMHAANEDVADLRVWSGPTNNLMDIWLRMLVRVGACE